MEIDSSFGAFEQPAPQISISQDEAYTSRVRLPGYAGEINVFQAVSARDAANVLIDTHPEWTRKDHRAKACLFDGLRYKMKIEWSATVDDAAMETFGREYSIIDYKVSGICNDAFSKEHKEKLRFLAHERVYYSKLFDAHLAAANSRRLPR